MLLFGKVLGALCAEWSSCAVAHTCNDDVMKKCTLPFRLPRVPYPNPSLPPHVTDLGLKRDPSSTVGSVVPASYHKSEI